MTALAKADELAMTIVAGSFSDTNVEALCTLVDEHLDRWIAADEAEAMEAIIVAYSTLGDVIQHINTRVGGPHGC